MFEIVQLIAIQSNYVAQKNFNFMVWLYSSTICEKLREIAQKLPFFAYSVYLPSWPNFRPNNIGRNWPNIRYRSYTIYHKSK